MTSKQPRWGLPQPAGAIPQRYEQLLDVIRDIKAKIILEIGAYRGIRARKMILTALETIGTVFYYGFDLFEDMTEVIQEKEASPKPKTQREVLRLISAPGVIVELIKGNTLDTLPRFVERNIRPDFVWIDGGHSWKTVQSDWDCIKQIMYNGTVVCFDDYLTGFEELGWGCNRIVNRLDRKKYKVELLPKVDKYFLKKIGSNSRVESETRIAKVVLNG